MARAELTPLEIQTKVITSRNLNNLLEAKGGKKTDIHKKTGIPTSTLSDYFTGKTLPNPGNLQKLADYFGVWKSDIDPRFKQNIELPRRGISSTEFFTAVADDNNLTGERKTEFVNSLQDFMKYKIFQLQA